jgi:ubiquinone/menaquinone biosynthesis C-methylase UbiE
MTYVYMKVLESAPTRYDRGMQLLTLGRLARVHRDLAQHLRAGDRVLDVGCGTGALAVDLARRGMHVTAIDISPAMLSEAAKRLHRARLEQRVTLLELGVAELDALPRVSFEAVASILVFSELSDDEIAYALAQCRRLLRPAGRLLVADEVLPDSTLGRVATLLLRTPFVVLAFLLTQTTTRRVAGLSDKIESAGFEITEVRRYLAGTLRLYVARKMGERAS